MVVSESTFPLSSAFCTPRAPLDLAFKQFGSYPPFHRTVENCSLRRRLHHVKAGGSDTAKNVLSLNLDCMEWSVTCVVHRASAIVPARNRRIPTSCGRRLHIRSTSRNHLRCEWLPRSRANAAQ